MLLPRVNTAMAKKEKKKEPDRILIAGKPDTERCNNKVVSARYTPLNFFPVVRIIRAVDSCGCACILCMMFRVIPDGSSVRGGSS